MKHTQKHALWHTTYAQKQIIQKHWVNISSLIAWRQTLMKLLRWPSLRMLETPCCLATFWRISRRLSLGSEMRRNQNYRLAVIWNNILHPATMISGIQKCSYRIRPHIRWKRNAFQIQTNTNFLLVNQISMEIIESRKRRLLPLTLTYYLTIRYHNMRDTAHLKDYLEGIWFLSVN